MITLKTQEDLHNFLQMAQYLSTLRENTKHEIDEYIDPASEYRKKWLDEQQQHMSTCIENEQLQKQVTTQKLLIDELNNRLSEVTRDANKANKASVEIINDLRQELAATIQDRDKRFSEAEKLEKEVAKLTSRLGSCVIQDNDDNTSS